MRIAIVHLSDFHIKEKDYFFKYKIDALVSAIKTVKNIDDYIVVFSGDLANTGAINEYKKSRYVIGNILAKIKSINDDRFVNLIMVPGNHDLSLPKDSRSRKTIQEYYDNNSVFENLGTEFSYLENFYKYSHAHNGDTIKLLHKKYIKFDNYTIQINAINTAPFSTLEPNDKELHYFPIEQSKFLKKGNNVDFCISVMHHNWEWFNWKQKFELENAIIDNSELVLMGHDHKGFTSSLSINNGYDTCISASGKINFATNESEDSFNLIVLDTKKTTIDGYIFNWDVTNRIFTHKQIVDQKEVQIRSSHLSPLPSFIKNLKYDSFNQNEDFEQYFVLPKMSIEKAGKYDAIQEIKNDSDLLQLIYKNKKIAITGATNSGKSTLLKHIYCKLKNNITPLYLTIESGTRIKLNKFVKSLFEEQYGDDYALFEKYQQLDKSKKSIIIDGIDLLDSKNNKVKLLKQIEEDFGTIIYCTDTSSKDIIDSIFEEIGEGGSFTKIHINPFYKESRSELVKNICMLHDENCDDCYVEQINNQIDKLVQKNISLFSLTPDFIIKYTNYYIESPQKDYVRGEAIFSKVFEYEIEKSIFKNVKFDDVDEALLMFEEIAGNMFTMQKDILTVDEINNIVNSYKDLYGTEITPKLIIEIGLKTKILKQFEDFSVCFYNKNHLAYFIAKYLIRYAQEDVKNYEKIQYAINNICFGINSDIILFISYVLNNMQIIKYIAQKAEELLSPWDELDLNEVNIDILNNPNRLIDAPTEDDKKEYLENEEFGEELSYSEEIISAKGAFDYDDSEIDKEHNKIIRAIKYTEMLCKALPSFNKNIKIEEKKALIRIIYSYPRKIVYALLEPISTNFNKIRDEIFNYYQSDEFNKNNKKKYSKEEIEEFIVSFSHATILGFFEHFADLCTSPKTIRFLLEKEVNDNSEQLEKIFIIQNNGNPDSFVKEAEKGINSNVEVVKLLTRMIVKRYLIVNKQLSHGKRQMIKDKFFTEVVRTKKSLPKKRKYLSAQKSEE